jgi:hypothetical protein
MGEDEWNRRIRISNYAEILLAASFSAIYLVEQTTLGILEVNAWTAAMVAPVRMEKAAGLRIFRIRFSVALKPMLNTTTIASCRLA